MEIGGTQGQQDGNLGGGSATRDADRAVHGRQYNLRRVSGPCSGLRTRMAAWSRARNNHPNLFAHQLQSAIRNPGLASFVLLAVFVIISILGTIWLRSKFTSKD